ncbi:MAG: hypothetical protein L3J11_07755 [Draconibacterium sp.]|nr:hypothetical protein [Draconibacterium sp.]
MSAGKPKIIYNGKGLSIVIENFGQVSSQKTTLKVFKISGDKNIEIAKTTIPSIKPYQSKTFELNTSADLNEKDNSKFLIYFNKGEENEEVNHFIN